MRVRVIQKYYDNRKMHREDVEFDAKPEYVGKYEKFLLVLDAPAAESKGKGKKNTPPPDEPELDESNEGGGDTPL